MGETASCVALPELSFIFAVARNGVIGDRGGLPWDYPEDRAFFEAATMGHAVVMGRRTWEENGVALPGRTNIVVSRAFSPPAGVAVAPDLDAALELAYAADPSPFVIGGACLFEAATPRATRAYVTEIPASPVGDTVFHFDRAAFRVVSRRASPSGLIFLVYERARST